MLGILCQLCGLVAENIYVCLTWIFKMYSVLLCIFSSPSFLQSNSAESVAMGLLRQFEGMQLPAASELDWLVPEHDAPQKVQHPAYT